MITEERGQTDDDEQYQRQDRAVVEQVRGGDIILDKTTEQFDVVMCQEFGDGEGGDGGHEDHDDTAIDARHGERDDDFPEAGPAVGTEVLRRFDEGVVHLLQGVIDRVDHERQVVVAKAEKECAFAQWESAHIEELDRSDRPQQEIDPHGQDEEHRHHFRRLEVFLGHDIRRRIADEEAYGGIEHRDHERIEEGLDGLMMGEELHEVAYREVAVDIGEGIDADEDERQDDEHRHEEDVRPSPSAARGEYLNELAHFKFMISNL